MTGAVWFMLLCCISWLNFLGRAFQAWVALHLYGRWGLKFLAMCRFWDLFFFGLDCNGRLSWLCVVMVLWILPVWMYEYFGVGLEIREEVVGIFPRFLCWLPKHRLSTPFRRSLEIWRLVIDNLTADDVSSSSFFLESSVLGYGLVPSHSGFLCDFSDAFKSLC